MQDSVEDTDMTQSAIIHKDMRELQGCMRFQKGS